MKRLIPWNEICAYPSYNLLQSVFGRKSPGNEGKCLYLHAVEVIAECVAKPLPGNVVKEEVGRGVEDGGQVGESDECVGR